MSFYLSYVMLSYASACVVIFILIGIMPMFMFASESREADYVFLFESQSQSLLYSILFYIALIGNSAGAIPSLCNKNLMTSR